MVNALPTLAAVALTVSLLVVYPSHARLKLFEFWNEDSRLPSDTLGRLSQLLAVLYSPSTEGQFLSCCTNLMLQLTWRSPDYSRPLFEVPLSECKFQVGIKWGGGGLAGEPFGSNGCLCVCVCRCTCVCMCAHTRAHTCISVCVRDCVLYFCPILPPCNHHP